MPTTIEEIGSFLDEEEVQYRIDEDRHAVLVGFELSPRFTAYRDRAGEPHFGVVIQPSEGGEFLALFAPWTWSLADCPHRSAVFEAISTFQARCKLIRFDYDPDDGELRANIEICLQDAPLTIDQFRRLLTSLGYAVFRIDPVVRHAMQTGEVSFDLLDSLTDERPEADLVRSLAEQAGGLEALERLVGGTAADEPASAEPDSASGPDPAG